MASVPLHLLTANETKLWAAGGQLQRALAAKLANQYRSGAGVLAWTGYLIAYVQPNGIARCLAPPFTHHERHEIANKPTPADCPCAEFYDPEHGGPWKHRNSADHHPACQFDRDAIKTITENNRLHGQGMGRPDLLIRLREEARGERGAKTGARKG